MTKRLINPFARMLAGLVTAAALLWAAGADAKPVPESEQLDRTERLPERLRGVDVRERLGELAPKDATFVDEQGKPVRLGDYLDGTLPVILTLNYSDCPMLCSLELNGLVAAMKQLDWMPGKQFRIVTVGLDPAEKPGQARKTKDRYVGQYGRPEAAAGWHFLTGSEASIRAVADSVGFFYGYNEKRKEYIHPAAIVLLSPEGKVSRYLYGIEYHPKTLRLSLADVAEGKVGSTLDQLVLFCFHYDEKEGRYAPVAMNIMRVSSGLGASLLGGFLASAWLVETRKRKKAQDPVPQASSPLPPPPSKEGEGRSSPS